MRSLLLAALATLAFGTAGCDFVATTGEDRIESSSGDGGVPYLDGNASYDPGAADATAGVQNPDAASPAIDVTGTCGPAECGEAPTTLPPCFTGVTAVAVCGRFIDGTCTWQLTCGP